VVICLERGADLHVAQLMPLPLTVYLVKSRLVLPFWYWLTWVVLEKWPLNGRVCVQQMLTLFSVAYLAKACPHPVIFAPYSYSSVCHHLLLATFFLKLLRFHVVLGILKENLYG